MEILFIVCINPRKKKKILVTVFVVQSHISSHFIFCIVENMCDGISENSRKLYWKPDLCITVFFWPWALGLVVGSPRPRLNHSLGTGRSLSHTDRSPLESEGVDTEISPRDIIGRYTQVWTAWALALIFFVLTSVGVSVSALASTGTMLTFSWRAFINSTSRGRNLTHGHTLITTEQTTAWKDNRLQ